MIQRTVLSEPLPICMRLCQLSRHRGQVRTAARRASQSPTGLFLSWNQGHASIRIARRAKQKFASHPEGMQISTAHIEPDLKATERYAAIRELLNLVVESGAIPRQAEPIIFAGLSRREAIMSTGVGLRLALPHTESGLVSETVFAFGRSRAGIQFEALDGLAVEFIFLFIHPSGRPITEGLAGLGSLGKVPKILERLRNCSTAQEIKQILETGDTDGS